jgi:hypothetical protein
VKKKKKVTLTIKEKYDTDMSFEVLMAVPVKILSSGM